MSNEDTTPRRPAPNRRRFLKSVAAGVATVTAGGRVAASSGSNQSGHETGRERVRVPDLTYFDVGDYEGVVLNDGLYPIPLPPDTATEFYFGDAPRDEVARALRDSDVEFNQLPFGPGWEFYLTRATGTVIETGEETVLVDTGHGTLPPGILLAFAQIARTVGGPLDVRPEEFLPGQLPSSLRAASLAPEDVDVVVLTHGHPDHVGGAVNGDGKPAFPNARYVMSRAEWAFWIGKPDLSPLSVSGAFEQYLRLAELTLPRLVRRVELVEDATEVAPGVTVLPAAGHTPGHLAVAVESQGEQFLHLGDAAQLPPHVPRPEWTGGIDYLPEETVATRRELYDRAASSDALTFGSHFPIPGFGKVRQVDDGWRWEPVKTG